MSLAKQVAERMTKATGIKVCDESYYRWLDGGSVNFKRALEKLFGIHHTEQLSTPFRRTELDMVLVKLGFDLGKCIKNDIKPSETEPLRPYQRNYLMAHWKRLVDERIKSAQYRLKALGGSA